MAYGGRDEPKQRQAWPSDDSATKSEEDTVTIFSSFFSRNFSRRVQMAIPQKVNLFQVYS